LSQVQDTTPGWRKGANWVAI